MVKNEEIIYFDNNATTRIDPEVYEAMVPYLTEYYGNPSSSYRFGKQVGGAIDEARERVASLLECEPREVFFTSCGTESDNAAINAALQTTGKRHILVSSVEHSAVKNHAEMLERAGYGVTFLPVKSDGTLEVSEVEKAIREDTAVVSLMSANNETGVLFPIEEVAELCKARNVLFHTDAVQCPGKIPLSLKAGKVDFLSLSGHKLHAPKGVGVLYLRRRVKFVPYVMGGHQERGKRGGTENTAFIVGLGKAAELAQQHLGEEQTRVRGIRDFFEEKILETIPGTSVNGCRDLRLPNTTNISFSGAQAEKILALLDEQNICASAGSACTTGSMEPSHVLKAMGLSEDKAFGAIRFSFSRYNTREEAEKVLAILPAVVEEVQGAKVKV